MPLNRLATSLRRLILPIALFLSAGIFLLDLVAYLGRAVWALYFIPLILTLWAIERRASIILAATVSGLIVLGMFSSYHSAPVPSTFANRAAGMGIAWLIALLILQRKDAEVALHKSQESYRLLFERNPHPMWVYDRATFAFLAVNEAAIRHYGYSREDFLGMTIKDIRPSADVPALLEYHATTLNRPAPEGDFPGPGYAGVWRHQKKDGALMQVEISVSPLVFSERDALLVLANDITERTRVEEEAKRMERLSALGQLLGGIAHQLKNPLFIITGYLQLLKAKLAQQEYQTLAEDLQHIEHAAQRMTHITTQFMSLAKPSPPRQEPCSVPALLQQTLAFLSNEFMKSQICVVTAIAPDLPTIWADPQQLVDAFLNLMLNAEQAMVAAHGHGTLAVTARLQERNLEIRIQDDGPGIPPEYRSQLFEPFFSTKPAGQGTGLGLWTVRTVVMALQGTIHCETEVGQGTTFVIRLPVKEEGQPSAPHA
ncbi:MAG: PAS domain-containing sensor histidine kinase [Gaiellales bacterium]|nr:MAG: PAS domain-containing sensor histidine kinase [Gaiellales bacterium]